MSDIANTLLNIKEDIEQGQIKLERLRGQRKATLDQLEQMDLTLAEAEKKQKKLQKDIIEADIELEKKINAFAKKYPDLEVDV